MPFHEVYAGAGEVQARRHHHRSGPRSAGDADHQIRVPAAYVVPLARVVLSARRLRADLRVPRRRRAAP